MKLSRKTKGLQFKDAKAAEAALRGETQDLMVVKWEHCPAFNGYWASAKKGIVEDRNTDKLYGVVVCDDRFEVFPLKKKEESQTVWEILK